MTGRSRNGTQPENGTCPESGRQPEGGQPQGSLLVREAEQASPSAGGVELGSGPAVAGTDSPAPSGTSQPDESRTDRSRADERLSHATLPREPQSEMAQSEMAQSQPVQSQRAQFQNAPSRKPLWRRLMDRTRHVFGSSHFVDDMLECAPVGTYAAMADEVLGPQQPGSQRSAAGSRDMHPSR